jgi:ZIP family zinc transporter
MALAVGSGLVLLVVLSTLAGGAVPLRFERHARTLLSFSAGTLVGLALLELIPEGIEGAGGGVHGKLLLVLGAFLATMLLDKLHVLHPHAHGMDEGCPGVEHEHRPLAMHGAIGLLLHSALDGVALAAAFGTSLATALAVALALSAHKFADGLTTVSLVLAHHHRSGQALRLLVGNAGLLLAGFAVGSLLALREEQLAHLVLVMAGFFLYLGASDLIPSVTVPLCRKRDVFATACGMAAIAVVSLLSH